MSVNDLHRGLSSSVFRVEQITQNQVPQGVPVRVRPPAPARRELRKFATTFYALHKKSSLTCSAAPRFKTVTASLGHSFVLPTWKLIHRVHMTRKTSFCPLGQKLVFSSEACLRHGKQRCAPGRCFAGKYLRKCVARFPSHRAKHDPSRQLRCPFTSRLRDPSLCALRKPS